MTRKTLLFLLLAGALLIVRGYRPEFHSISIDEAWDLQIAALPAGELVACLAHPPQSVLWPPPLHHLLLHWLLPLFPAALAGARLLSGFWNLAALAVVFFALRDRLPGWVLALVLLFAVIHPFQQLWGQQTRAYAFLQFLSVATYALLARFLARPVIPTALLLFLLLVAGAYTHYFYLLVGAAAAVIVVVRPAAAQPRRARLILGVTAGLALLAFLPWTATMLQRTADPTVINQGSATSPLTILRTVSQLVTGSPLPRSGLTLGAKYLGSAAFLGLLLFALPALRRQWWLTLPVVVPFGLAFLVGNVAPVFAARYLIVLHLPLLLLTAPAFTGRRARLALGCAAVYLLCLAVNTGYLLVHEYPFAEDLQGAARAIARQYDPATDRIVCVAPYTRAGIAYYLPESRGYRYAEAYQPEGTGGGRIWLVWCHWAYYDPRGEFLARLQRERPLLDRQDFPRVELYRFGEPR